MSDIHTTDPGAEHLYKLTRSDSCWEINMKCYKTKRDVKTSTKTQSKLAALLPHEDTSHAGILMAAAEDV